MKDSLKNTFPLDGMNHLLKLIPPNFNHGFSQQKKGSEQKHTDSTRQKVSFR